MQQQEQQGSIGNGKGCDIFSSDAGRGCRKQKHYAARVATT
jgi:hypothetical protein